ncbi:MAG TPA: bifunctional cytidylyltransferase/SDR family oxidoreductase, partial [Candidatus Limnocylindria bacterium]
MLISAILLAGGDGNRFGGEVPKQFLRLAGEEILLRSVQALVSAQIDELVVVAHARWITETERIIALAGDRVPTRVVEGGNSRNESTWNGLMALTTGDDDVVVVHDAVRPLLPHEVLRRSIDPVVEGLADGTDTVIPSADTLVIVEGGVVVEIPDRSRYRRGQTPQVFRKGVLVRAYEAARAAGDMAATDDCSLVLRHVPGARILAVPGDEVNLKITTRLDMVMADRMIQLRTIGMEEDATVAASLDEARLLVVGGSQGIGLAIADEARQLGARVETLSRSNGLDVRDAADVRRQVDEVAGRLGGLDHVVVTAGVLTVGRVGAESLDAIHETIDVNLTGTLNVAVAAYPHLCATRGSFTVFASSSFTRGRAEYVAYSASKAAVVNMAQGLAEEWHDDGIRVNAVSPERTDTPMRRRAFPEESHALLLTSEEVARATVRLIRSDLTGQVLDG